MRREKLQHNAQAIMPTSCTDADDGRTSQDRPPRGILPVCPELALFPRSLGHTLTNRAESYCYFGSVVYCDSAHRAGSSMARLRPSVCSLEAVS